MSTATMTPKKSTARNPEQSGPPVVDRHPAVAELLGRHAKVRADLAAERNLRADLERRLSDRGLSRNVNPVAAEARKLAGISTTSDDTIAADLAACDQRMQALTEADNLLSPQLTPARAEAARELAGEAKAYAAPAIRRAVTAYLDGWIAMPELDAVRSQLAGAGFSTTDHAASGIPMQQFSQTVANGLGMFINEKMQAGVLSRDEAAAYHAKLGTR